jgi:hypothetical protein
VIQQQRLEILRLRETRLRRHRHWPHSARHKVTQSWQDATNRVEVKCPGSLESRHLVTGCDADSPSLKERFLIQSPPTPTSQFPSGQSLRRFPPSAPYDWNMQLTVQSACSTTVSCVYSASADCHNSHSP